MPELPEVEVTRRRLEQELLGQRIEQVEIRTLKLRLPIPPELKTVLPGHTIRAVERRGKYLLFDCEIGWLIIHLGMTGFLRLVGRPAPPEKHDHVDIILEGGPILRFRDPRKFGTVLWTTGVPADHPLLTGIGPEPLTAAFDGQYLFTVSRSRKVAVKQLLMNAAVVAGIGNIYANEALFRAGVRPDRPSCSLTLEECGRLAAMIREVLEESIGQGSTYRVAEEQVVYHPFAFAVYGRGKEICTQCGNPLKHTRLGNRSTVFCPYCQK